MPASCSREGRAIQQFGRSRTLLLPFAAVVALAGCKPVGPNYTRPQATAPAAYKEIGASSVTLPPPPPSANWKPANPSDGMLKGKWWEIYNDPQLNQLEDRITPDNFQLKEALENYLAAHDQIAALRANLYPQFAAGVQASRTRVSYNQAGGVPASKATSSAYEIQGVASWEPDFFGRVRRSVEQARANAQLSAADMASLDLALHAEMASDYFQLRGLDSQTKLLTQTVADLEHQLDLTQRRLSGGVATAVDVAQAQTELDNTRAQLIEVGVLRAQYQHAIATIADLDVSTFAIPPTPLELALPKVPTGVPSQLLERRPDIAAAERAAAAANAQIGIEISAYYPTIPLGVSGGFESGFLGTFIQGPSAIWSLGAQATELLFDAGQRHALTDAARHSYQAQVDGYRNTVLSAFEDVEDELSNLRILEQEAGVEDQAVAEARHSFDLSNQRYTGGVTSYLEVLTAEQTLIQDESTDISLRTRQFAASVSLVRALGGGWDTSQLPQ